jgi:PKD repeat protein
MAKNHWFPLLHLSFLMILIPQTYVLPLHNVDIDVRGSELWNDGGNGTVQNPFQIDDVMDLQNMSNNLSAHYILVNDIDASETKTWNNGLGFIPIGNSTFRFNGSLDGGGFNITHLSIINKYETHMGLFGHIDIGGRIMNVSIRNSTISGKQPSGLLVGFNLGSISNSSVRCKPEEGSNIYGGMVGTNDGTIADCIADCDMSWPFKSFSGLLAFSNGPKGMIVRSSTHGRLAGQFYCGGIVYQNHGLISDCLSTANVTSFSQYAGGLTGMNFGTIKDSIFSGSVYGPHSGGIAGYNNGSIKDCHVHMTSAAGSGIVGLNEGHVSDCEFRGSIQKRGTYMGDYVGGIAGKNTFGGTLKNCHVFGILNELSFVSGIAGENGIGSSIHGCTFFGSVNGSSCVAGISGINAGKITNSTAVGNITGSGDYISGGVGLNEEDGSIISLQVRGNVSGSNYIGGISGYNRGSISGSSSYCNISGNNYIGGISGECTGPIQRSYSISSVHGDVFIGGLVGYLTGQIINSYFDGDVEGSYFLGGLVGMSEYYTKVINSHFNIESVEINGKNSASLGGLYDLQYKDWLSNEMSLDIEDYNSSLVFNGSVYCIDDIQGMKDLLGFSDDEDRYFTLSSDIDLKGLEDYYVPHFSARSFDGDYHIIKNIRVDLTYASDLGLFGCNDGGMICDLILRDVWVRGYANVGGIVGSNNPSSCIYNSSVNGVIIGEGPCVGGIVGINYGDINRTYSIGKVAGTYSIGGIAGSNMIAGKIDNSYSCCDISGETKIGGLVGENLYKSMISNSYSTGSVGSTYMAGGLVGLNIGEVINSFWDKETSKCNGSSGGYGRTTGEMMERSTFSEAGWDLNDTWGIYKNMTYPYLLWQERTSPIANAGTDIIVDEDTQVSFDGRASYDDHGIAIFKWSFTEGDNGVDLFGPFPSYTFLSPGEYTIILNVSDFSGKWDIDTLQITILDITKPKAVAGTDRVIDEDTTVILDGTKSHDNTAIVRYHWSIVDGDNLIELEGAINPITFTEPGYYIVQLNVTDGSGLFDTDGFSVLVRDITPPKADAGDDRSVIIGDRIFFDGSGSQDNVGIVNYTWTFQTDGEMVSLYGPGPSHIFDEWGTFKVTLTVMDPSGLIGIDSMSVRTMDPIDPIADAGPDLTVYEDVLVAFNGNGSSDNVGIDNYTWSINGKDIVLLYGVTPSHIFTNPGTYTMILIVTDLEGRFSRDTSIVTVLDRTPPVADAGTDFNHNEDTEMVLDGGNSSDNVGIDRYQWSIKDGPDITHYEGRFMRHTFTDPGLFSVILTVTDASGLTDTDDIMVHIIDRTVPEAQAGPDLEVEAGDTVHFNGSGSMDNGVITEYKWNIEIEGGTTVISGKDTIYEFQDPGRYTVTLIVVDSGGNKDEDTMIVMVHGPKPFDWPLIFFIGIVLIVSISIAYLIARKSRSHQVNYEE